MFLLSGGTSSLGTPKNVTLEMIYQAQIDILENQARQENMFRELLSKMR